MSSHEKAEAPDPLEVNKETLQDLDLEPANADLVKGGVSGSGVISRPTASGVPNTSVSYHPTVPTLLSTG